MCPKAVKNMYQSESNLMYSEKMYSYNRRESNTSIASGIYEEIRDDICSPKSKTSFTSNEYKNTNKILCNLQMEPPALPPRQKQRPQYIEKDGYDCNFLFQMLSKKDIKYKSNLKE